MIAAISGLILALAALIAVCGFLFILYKPPKALKKFKLKDYFEGEFLHQPPSAAVEVIPATPALGTAEAAPPPTPQEQVQQEPSPETADTFSAIMKAFEEHRYTEGLRLSRTYVASGEQSSRFKTEAGFLWMAHVEGNPEAYADAEKLAATHPQDYDAQYYFGLLSQRTGKSEAALTLLTKAMSLATDDEGRVNVAISLQRILSRMDRRKEALEILHAELQRTALPEFRAKLFVSMAKAYLADTAPDYRSAFLMYELAIQNAPDDTSLRFEVAYSYSEQKAHELAFTHYRRLFNNEPRHATALNNIGVDAESLELPVTAVSYYRQAEDLGSTLASSNLANRFIDAGFKKEAEALIAAAQLKPDVHRNVSVSVGKAAEAEINEEHKIKQISERAGKARKWHIRQGEAMLQPCDASGLSGSYSGTPVGLVLSVQSDGSATGTFALTSTTTAVITGTVSGRALTFDWSGENNEKSVLRYLSRKSGQGILIASGNGQLDGYWTEGTNSLDSVDVDKWTRWHLSKI